MNKEAFIKGYLGKEAGAWDDAKNYGSKAAEGFADYGKELYNDTKNALWANKPKGIKELQTMGMTPTEASSKNMSMKNRYDNSLRGVLGNAMDSTQAGVNSFVDSSASSVRNHLKNNASTYKKAGSWFSPSILTSYFR